MQLAQDLLLTDIELANPDPEKGAILQLAALLLDKNNLLEKRSFHSLVRASFFDTNANLHAKNLNGDPEVIKKSPRQTEVLQGFTATFPPPWQFACFGTNVLTAFNAACKKSMIKYPVTLPIFDAWTALYTRLSPYTGHKLPNLETFAGHFKLKLNNPLSALERVKLTAELLRKVL